MSNDPAYRGDLPGTSTLADQLKARLAMRSKVQSDKKEAPSTGVESDEARFKRIYDDESCWESGFGNGHSILPSGGSILR